MKKGLIRFGAQYLTAGRINIGIQPEDSQSRLFSVNQMLR